MSEFSEVLGLLAQLKREGAIADYAVGGAIAAAFWDEAIATQDLDVVVVYAEEPSTLDPLRPILDRLPQSEFPRDGEHVVIAGVPVQFLPAWSPLVIEGVREAKEISYDPGSPASPTLRVMMPTYLAAIWQTDPGALTPKRRERIARMAEAGLIDEPLLKRLIGSER